MSNITYSYKQVSLSSSNFESLLADWFVETTRTQNTVALFEIWIQIGVVLAHFEYKGWMNGAQIKAGLPFNDVPEGIQQKIKSISQMVLDCIHRYSNDDQIKSLINGRHIHSLHLFILLVNKSGQRLNPFPGPDSILESAVPSLLPPVVESRNQIEKHPVDQPPPLGNPLYDMQLVAEEIISYSATGVSKARSSKRKLGTPLNEDDQLRKHLRSVFQGISEADIEAAKAFSERIRSAKDQLKQMILEQSREMIKDRAFANGLNGKNFDQRVWDLLSNTLVELDARAQFKDSISGLVDIQLIVNPTELVRLQTFELPAPDIIQEGQDPAMPGSDPNSHETAINAPPEAVESAEITVKKTALPAAFKTLQLLANIEIPKGTEVTVGELDFTYLDGILAGTEIKAVGLAIKHLDKTCPQVRGISKEAQDRLNAVLTQFKARFSELLNATRAQVFQELSALVLQNWDRSMDPKTFEKIFALLDRKLKSILHHQYGLSLDQFYSNVEVWIDLIEVDITDPAWISICKWLIEPNQANKLLKRKLCLVLVKTLAVSADFLSSKSEDREQMFPPQFQALLPDEWQTFYKGFFWSGVVIRETPLGRTIDWPVTVQQLSRWFTFDSRDGVKGQMQKCLQFVELWNRPDGIQSMVDRATERIQRNVQGREVASIAQFVMWSTIFYTRISLYLRNLRETDLELAAKLPERTIEVPLTGVAVLAENLSAISDQMLRKQIIKMMVGLCHLGTRNGDDPEYNRLNIWKILWHLALNGVEARFVDLPHAPDYSRIPPEAAQMIMASTHAPKGILLTLPVSKLVDVGHLIQLLRQAPVDQNHPWTRWYPQLNLRDPLNARSLAAVSRANILRILNQNPTEDFATLASSIGRSLLDSGEFDGVLLSVVGELILAPLPDLRQTQDLLMMAQFCSHALISESFSDRYHPSVICEFVLATIFLDTFFVFGHMERFDAARSVSGPSQVLLESVGRIIAASDDHSRKHIWQGCHDMLIERTNIAPGRSLSEKYLGILRRYSSWVIQDDISSLNNGILCSALQVYATHWVTLVIKDELPAIAALTVLDLATYIREKVTWERSPFGFKCVANFIQAFERYPTTSVGREIYRCDPTQKPELRHLSGYLETLSRVISEFQAIAASEPNEIRRGYITDFRTGAERFLRENLIAFIRESNGVIDNPPTGKAIREYPLSTQNTLVAHLKMYEQKFRLSNPQLNPPLHIIPGVLTREQVDEITKPMPLGLAQALVNFLHSS